MGWKVKFCLLLKTSQYPYEVLSSVTDCQMQLAKKNPNKQNLPKRNKVGSQRGKSLNRNPHCTCWRTHHSSFRSEGASTDWTAGKVPGIREQRLHFEDLERDGLKVPIHPRCLVSLCDPLCSSHWQQGGRDNS